MTQVRELAQYVGPVESYDACPDGDQCAHCKAGRPVRPAGAEDPRQLDGAAVELHEDPDTDQAMRWALPPAYHRPVWLDTLRPKGWFCACCWDEGQLTQWPCMVATRHGDYLARSWRAELGQAEKHNLILTRTEG